MYSNLVTHVNKSRKKIRLIRESLELGREEFCKKTGIPKPSLIKYETDRAGVSGNVLSAIARIWPEYSTYLLTDKTEVKQRNPEIKALE